MTTTHPDPPQYGVYRNPALFGPDPTDQPYAVYDTHQEAAADCDRRGNGFYVLTVAQHQ